jgi:hypothetical protein
VTAASFYNTVIRHRLNKILALAREDPARVTRVRSRCGQVMTLLGLGWEWARNFAIAEETLLAAIDLGSSSPVELQAREGLERVREKQRSEIIRKERRRSEILNQRAVADATTSTAQKREQSSVSTSLKALGWIFAGVVIVLIIIGMLSPLDSATQTPPPRTISKEYLDALRKELEKKTNTAPPPRTAEQPDTDLSTLPPVRPPSPATHESIDFAGEASHEQ